MKTRKNLYDKFFVPKKSKGFFREIRFLIRLNNEGKLQIVEPSDEISESYIKKSERFIIAIKNIIKRLSESDADKLKNDLNDMLSNDKK